jgi:hypothetical protein
MSKLRRIAVGVLSALAVMLPLQFLVPAVAQAATFTPLTLKNGWTGGAPFGAASPAVANVSGIIHLRGAMATAGTNPVPFTLPKAFRPAAAVDVPVDLCDADNGKLLIQPTGVVTVQAEAGNFANAACRTSLDGVSFAQNASLFTSLTLKNGWISQPFGTSNAAVRVINGVVHFQGAIAEGINPVPFTLPSGFRPATAVYVPVTMCGAVNGRLFIQPNGVVTVQAEHTFDDASCFTSLDGASFAKNATSYTPLALQNGWAGAPFGTSTPAVRMISGIVQLKGAMAAGTNIIAFTLPAGFRPAHNVFVKVDLCNATNGHLIIQPDGTVEADGKTGAFSNAQCFTSLDGVSFAP